MTTKNLQAVDVDVEQIRRLTSDYAWAIDNLNLDELMSLFTEDAVFDMRSLGAPAAAEGGAAVRESFAAMIKGLRNCVHMMMNHRIDVEGDTAVGTAYCHAYSTTASGDKAENLVLYRDRYVREVTGWKFQSRVIHPLMKED